MPLATRDGLVERPRTRMIGATGPNVSSHHELASRAHVVDHRRARSSAPRRPPPQQELAPAAVGVRHAALEARARPPRRSPCRRRSARRSGSPDDERARDARVDRARRARRRWSASTRMPLHRGAALPAVLVRAGHREPDGLLEVGVVEHDQRIVAAELEDRRAGSPADAAIVLPTADAARERSATSTAGCSSSAARDRRAARPVTIGERAGRQPGLVEDAGQPERRERRLLRRLEHHRRSRRRCAGRDLVRDLVERVVERGDRRDEPHRLAHACSARRERPLARRVAREAPPVVAERLHGCEAKDVHRPRAPRSGCRAG